MSDDAKLPFRIGCRYTGEPCVTFNAEIDGETITSERYRPGNGDRRRKVASLWAADSRLCNGCAVDSAAIATELERVENELVARIDAGNFDAAPPPEPQPGPEKPAELVRAAYVDDGLIVELAWNVATGRPDFIVYDRAARCVSRRESVELRGGLLIPPKCGSGVLTPGSPIDGSVYLPSDRDEAGIDEARLRQDIQAFMHAYVELPPDTEMLCVEYVLLTHIHGDFDELPYLAFRTADLGRGKSRALETVAAICYRPIFCGGGSTAAATLRIVDALGGTLVADEFDQKRDTELAAALTQLLNQGFQRNRPLVKCDGESNEPRAFRCFGPKIFALRRGFADDATESRCVSVRMRQRTRRDIPLSLPRMEFDRRALVLRNKLLAWRFANSGEVAVNPAHADPRLEDRANQIGLPLFAVARTPEARARVAAALLEQQASVASDRADSLAGAVFEIILATAKPGDTIRPGDVAKAFNERRARDQGVEIDRLPRGDRLSPNKAGWILKRDLELPKLDHDRGGSAYLLDPTRLAELGRRFGIAQPEAGGTPVTLSQSTHCHGAELSPAGNPLSAPENAAGDNVTMVTIPEERPLGRDNVLPAKPAAAPPAGLVPDGWAPLRWADRLDELATGREELNPGAAAEHRARAAAIRAAEKNLISGLT